MEGNQPISTEESSLKDENNNPEEILPLLPPIPLNYKRHNTKTAHNDEILSTMDSSALFQSGSLLNNNPELKPMSSLHNTSSSQFPQISLLSDSNLLLNNGSIERFNTEQQESKMPEFPSKEINIEFYFNDLFSREINAPHLSTKNDLFIFIDQYSIENYASKHFRKQKSMIFFNTQNVHQLTTFSDQLLTKPLLERIPLEKSSITEKISNLILAYTKSNNEKSDNIILSFISILHDEESLVDEFFMQIMKFIRENPNKQAVHLSCKLFLIMIYMFLIKDKDVANVIRWFLIHKLFEGDEIESKFARYTLIKLYERSTLGRNFDLSMPKNEILRIPNGVDSGKRMFKCSLYTQLWNQRKKFPKLPIPLALYLIVKALVKNGVMITPKPFPNIGYKKMNSTNSTISNTKSDKKGENFNEKDKSDKNEQKIEKNKPKDDTDKSKSEINKNKQKNDTDLYTGEINDSKNVNNNDDDNEMLVNECFYLENEENESKQKNGSDESAARSKSKSENLVRKSDMKIVMKWAAKMNVNNDIINDGEVSNLMGLLITWMLNLLDPIIPKSKAASFVELFKSEKLNEKQCMEFVNDLPLLHKNTLKYIVGFLREIAQNENLTHENHISIAENFGCYFVRTSYATIDPFTRQKMIDFSPRFLLFCLDNLDVIDVYPLNPVYEVINEEI